MTPRLQPKVVPSGSLQLFGKAFDDAHDAAYDVDATAKCFFGVLNERVIKPILVRPIKLNTAQRNEIHAIAEGIGDRADGHMYESYFRCLRGILEYRRGEFEESAVVGDRAPSPSAGARQVPRVRYAPTLDELDRVAPARHLAALDVADQQRALVPHQARRQHETV